MPPADAIAAEIARSAKGHFNLIHADTGLRAHLYTAGCDEFNAWAFRNACKTEFSGETITLAPPEYVILRKLEFYRDGGSDKHLRDIRTMLNVSSVRINQADLQEWIRQRGVKAEWEKVVGSK